MSVRWILLLLRLTRSVPEKVSAIQGSGAPGLIADWIPPGFGNRENDRCLALKVVLTEEEI
jgi:hypothetical protein